MGDAPQLPDHIATIPDALAFWMEAMPDALALCSTDGRELSHRQLHAANHRVVDQLAARGVTRQNRVALLLPAGLDACVALLGVMGGAIAAPLNHAASAAELSRDLARLRPELLVTGGTLEASAREIAVRLAIPVISIDALLAPLGVEAALSSRSSAEPGHFAVIQHTSGTTALPKRAPRTHSSYAAAVRVARDSLRLTPRDRLLLTASAHNNLGLADLLAALLSGGSCVVSAGFDPRSYPGLLRAHRPTWAVLTPYEIALLLDHADGVGMDDVAGPASRLRAILAEAQAIAPGLIERAERRLRAPVLTGYGMTEAGNIAKFGIDALGVDVPAGRAGEIVVRGPTVFSGYLDEPDATAAAFLPGGWFRTGDHGYLDQDGYLYLTGRLGETINRGGAKIAPQEVEQILAEHPAVAEAALFSIPDGRLGEDIVAAVVLKPGVTASPRELREWLLGRAARFKVPRRVWFVDSLPRTPTGKVQRGTLAERFLGD